MLTDAILLEWNSPEEGARERVLSTLLPGLFDLDPLAAARLVEKVSPEAGRAELMHSLAQLWGGRHSAAALKWAEQLADPGERREALVDITHQMAGTDPAAAVAVAEKNHLGEGEGEVMEYLMMSWAEKDMQASLAWINLQPPGTQKDAMIARVAFAQAQTSPAQAAALVVSRIPPGPAQDEAAMSVLNRWAYRDFAAAMDWVERFPDSPLRKRAFHELAGIGGHVMAADETESRAEAPPVEGKTAP